MADDFHAAVLDRDQEARDYRPLALMAVAAFAVSLLFSTAVIVLTIVGLVTRKPFLEAWLIPVAFIGVLLSVAARWQIALSEGTREGRRLVSVAWWISLVGGAVYGAYYVGNIEAIKGQARTFARDALLKRLQEQKYDDAFAATVEPKQRKGMNLNDVRKRFGDIVAPFRLEPLSRLFERAGGVAEIEDAGTPEWRHASDGLLVMSRFFIRTPEGKFEVNVAVVGVENPETSEREWFIKRNGCGVKPMGLSTYGGLMSGLQEEADGFMSSWLHEKRFYSRRADMYYDSIAISREERKQASRVFDVRALLAPNLADLTSIPMGGAGMLSFGARFNQYDPLIALFTAFDKDGGYVGMPARLIKWDETKQKQEEAKKKAMLPFMLLPDYTQGAMSTAMLGPQRTNIEVLPDRLRASLLLEVSLPILRYRCQGRMYAECTDKEIVEELNRRKGAIDTGVDESRQILKSTRHEWTISKLVIDLAPDNTDMRPAAGGGLGKVEAPFGGKK